MQSDRSTGIQENFEVSDYSFGKLKLQTSAEKWLY